MITYSYDLITMIPISISFSSIYSISLYFNHYLYYSFFIYINKYYLNYY